LDYKNNKKRPKLGCLIKNVYFCRPIKGGVKLMIIVPIKEGENIERALKKFKRKFEKTGIVRELRSRKTFVKKSVKRREEVKKAVYVQAMHRNEE
jgi:small subunit ribosomal protein S21